MMNEENNNVDVEITTESYKDTETISTERKPRSRERGPDKKSRTYWTNSMSNLTQFKERPEEFTKYLKDEKGIDMTGNSVMWKILFIIVGVAFAGFGGWWVYNHYKNRKDNDIENKY